jgi:hypothetical protein
VTERRFESHDKEASVAVEVTVGGGPTLEARDRMRQQDLPLEERFTDDFTDYDAADGNHPTDPASPGSGSSSGRPSPMSSERTSRQSRHRRR